jgi:uncharacterized protein
MRGRHRKSAVHDTGARGAIEQQCKAEMACILGMYDRRIDQLMMVMSAIRAKGPF